MVAEPRPLLVPVPSMRDLLPRTRLPPVSGRPCPARGGLASRDPGGTPRPRLGGSPPGFDRRRGPLPPLRPPARHDGPSDPGGHEAPPPSRPGPPAAGRAPAHGRAPDPLLPFPPGRPGLPAAGSRSGRLPPRPGSPPRGGERGALERDDLPRRPNTRGRMGDPAPIVPELLLLGPPPRRPAATPPLPEGPGRGPDRSPESGDGAEPSTGQGKRRRISSRKRSTAARTSEEGARKPLTRITKAIGARPSRSK